MSDMIPPRQQNTRKKKRSGFITGFLLVIAFLVAACAGAYYASSSSLFDKPEKTSAKTEKRIAATDKTIVMLMGVDQRQDDVGRSDTLMIATIDPKKDKAALLSVPRDTRVKIKGHGYEKINHAYAYGGHKLSQSTVENLLDVSIDHYVIIDTHAFPRIIDAIGGVDIDVEKRMYYEDPWDDDGGLLIDFQPGMQHMDGKTAITYVRYRDEEGDIGRVRRQQNFMKAVLDKVTSPAIIPSLPNIIKEIFIAVKTDLSLKQMMELAFSLKDAHKNSLETNVVPGQYMYIDGISYLVPDLKKLRHIVAETLDVTTSSSDRDAWEKESIEYTKEIPSSAVHISEEDHNRHIEKEERAFEKNRRSDDRSEPSSTAKDKNTQEKDNISNDTTTSKTENDTNGFTIDTTSDTNSNSSQSSDASYPSSPRIIEIEETPSVPEPTAQKGKNQ